MRSCQTSGFAPLLSLAEKLNAKRFKPCTTPNWGLLPDPTACISMHKKMFAIPLYHTCNSTAFQDQDRGHIWTMSNTNPVADDSDSDSKWSRALCHSLDSDKHQLFVEDNSPHGHSTPYIDLSTLQRLNIYHLQRNLVLCVKGIIEAKKTTSQIPLDLMNKLPGLLTPYCRIILLMVGDFF